MPVVCQAGKSSSEGRAITANEGLAVRCRGPTKHYGYGAAAVTALREAVLDVPFGELLMLVGPSGCGKTTLASIITTLLRPGECEVLGLDARRMDEGASFISLPPVLKSRPGVVFAAR